MAFKVTDLALRININFRDDAQVEVLGCGENSIRVNFDACGRTNKPQNDMFPDFEFAGKMRTMEQFERLRTAVRELSRRLDAIDAEEAEEEEEQR
ncbi:MAG TPA: hypothetical protein VHC97_05050 [Thermoanaerobaculia bacterium]|jgi:hypothetical protein|nr:hypothetical protein [Thermoanaerobaculia bacterium]